jgi:thiosulfate sulfurtransferase
MERTVSCATLAALIADRAEIAILDVRRRPAFDADPVLVPGAIWKDPEQVMTWAAELNRGQPAVAYCVHGHEVSRGVVDRLRAAGIAAALLEGGIEAWKASGGALTRPERDPEQAG